MRAELSVRSTSRDLGDARARALSRMLTFDFVIANWDRWSGGNVGEAREGLVFVDNDAAFYEPVPPAFAAASRAFFDMGRFSRAFVERLRATRSQLAEIVGTDDTGRALLTHAQLSSLGARVDAALAHVDATRSAHGDATVLAFP